MRIFLCFLIFDSIAIVVSADVECGVEGAKAIAAMLAENDTLIELVLNGMIIDQHREESSFIVPADNRFGDDGATAIADALHTNATLKSIDIRSKRSVFVLFASTDA